MQTLNGRRIHQSVSFQFLPTPWPCTDLLLGNPGQLGIPIKQHEQGGYLEPLPHLRRRLEQ